MKTVQTGSYKAEAGHGAETFESREPKREPKQIVSAPRNTAH
jgi:hypothetical protein